MRIPFTISQFMDTFAAYNTGVFPMQIIIWLLGLGAAAVLFSHFRARHMFIGLVLGALWLWAGIVYQLGFFSGITKPAYVFGLLFIVQGLIFAVMTVKRRLEFTFNRQVFKILGVFFVAYGLVIYPLVCLVFDNAPGHVISLGLPCPTVIFTFGLLLLLEKPLPWYALIIPVIWALIGISAALNLGIYQDFMMPAAALCTIRQSVKHRRRSLTYDVPGTA